MRLCLLVILSSLVWLRAEAYPNFIGYGYNACITCHYSGQGGGALNDYGRALFATEITARDLYPDTMDEEEIGNKSGFLGTKPLPWWVRPGVKYRGLWFQNNPGSTNSTDKFYNMQSDINLNFFFDQQQTYTLITTASYTTYPRSFATSREDKTPYWFAKEYYLRWKTTVKNLWVYLGQMDKVYGLRVADHTSVSRSPIGLGQFDQSQGVIVEYSPAKWNIAGNIFFGNAAEEPEVRQKGLSVSGEYEIYEKYRVGGSAMTSKSETVEWLRLAGFTRMGLSKGSSLMAEVGLTQNKSLLPANGNALKGMYATLESWVLIRRGYNLLSTIEYAKADLESTASEKMRWSIGGIMFPLPRTEVRTMLVNSKYATPDTGVPDNWQLQMQLHLSL
ncbi:hypothetical protein [Bdellovibrio sp. HCB337]|uniref:hypothetical protein n=1 Tax=Bdellovibrio sp. HCB337 TaxID=3394358 RepID=UPI0039A49282